MTHLPYGLTPSVIKKIIIVAVATASVTVETASWYGYAITEY